MGEVNAFGKRVSLFAEVRARVNTALVQDRLRENAASGDGPDADGSRGLEKRLPASTAGFSGRPPHRSDRYSLSGGGLPDRDHLVSSSVDGNHLDGPSDRILVQEPSFRSLKRAKSASLEWLG